MSENVQFVSLTSKPAGKTTRLSLKYKKLVGPKAGEEWTVGNLACNLSNDAKNLLKASNQGDYLSIDITKEGNFWNLVDVKKGEQTTTQNTTNSTAGNTRKSTDFNVGVKVGQARNQAVQILCARLEAGLTKTVSRDDIINLAFDLICDIEHMEEMIAKGENPSKLSAEQENTLTQQHDQELQATDEDILF